MRVEFNQHSPSFQKNSTESNCVGTRELTALERFDELRTEEQVCTRFKHLVSAYELRAARRAGEITFVQGKRGIVLYHPLHLATYLQYKEVPCRSDSSNTKDIRFEASGIRPNSMHAGTTNSEDARLADHLERKYSKKRRKS